MIAIGSDHAGYEAKEEIKKYLSKYTDYKDFGTYNKESCDYPLIAAEVALNVAKGECEKGILVCGTGIGVCIAANKIKNARAALCYDVNTAEMSRSHNNANILCLGARVTDISKMNEMIKAFLTTDFAKGRHEKRVNQIKEIENKYR